MKKHVQWFIYSDRVANIVLGYAILISVLNVVGILVQPFAFFAVLPVLLIAIPVMILHFFIPRPKRDV